MLNVLHLSQVLGLSVTEYRGYDNVLLGQGYHTPRGAVIAEYGAVVEW
jgi:hypothetical protein